MISPAFNAISHLGPGSLFVVVAHADKRRANKNILFWSGTVRQTQNIMVHAKEDVTSYQKRLF